MAINSLQNQKEASAIEREVVVHQTLDHPNIIKLYDAFIENKIIYMILEWAKNGNLYSYLYKKRSLQEDEAFKYFLQSCKAIDYLHNIGILHRDIKPENLLLDDQFNIKLCDFGWICDDFEHERNTFCGTYEYMAPEIIFKQAYDYRIDLWALGILLYELLHGKAPFRGRTFEEVQQKVIEGNVVFSGSIGNGPKYLIARILQSDPVRRVTLDDIFFDDWVVAQQIKQKNQQTKSEISYSSFVEVPNKYDSGKKVKDFEFVESSQIMKQNGDYLSHLNTDTVIGSRESGSIQTYLDNNYKQQEKIVKKLIKNNFDDQLSSKYDDNFTPYITNESEIDVKQPMQKVKQIKQTENIKLKFNDQKEVTVKKVDISNMSTQEQNRLKYKQSYAKNSGQISQMGSVLKKSQNTSPFSVNRDKEKKSNQKYNMLNKCGSDFFKQDSIQTTKRHSQSKQQSNPNIVQKLKSQIFGGDKNSKTNRENSKSKNIEKTFQLSINPQNYEEKIRSNTITDNQILFLNDKANRSNTPINQKDRSKSPITENRSPTPITPINKNPINPTSSFIQSDYKLDQSKPKYTTQPQKEKSQSSKNTSRNANEKKKSNIFDSKPIKQNYPQTSKQPSKKDSTMKTQTDTNSFIINDLQQSRNNLDKYLNNDLNKDTSKYYTSDIMRIPTTESCSFIIPKSNNQNTPFLQEKPKKYSNHVNSIDKLYNQKPILSHQNSASKNYHLSHEKKIYPRDHNNSNYTSSKQDSSFISNNEYQNNNKSTYSNNVFMENKPKQNQDQPQNYQFQADSINKNLFEPSNFEENQTIYKPDIETIIQSYMNNPIDKLKGYKSYEQFPEVYSENLNISEQKEKKQTNVKEFGQNKSQNRQRSAIFEEKKYVGQLDKIISRLDINDNGKQQGKVYVTKINL